MFKSEKTEFVKYEFVININVIDNIPAYKVNNVLLTEDDLSDMSTQSSETNWISAGEVDVIDIDEIGNDSFSESKKRICGLFNAEPRDWKYAQMVISDQKNKKNIYTIGKMPQSPIIPVIFELQNS